MGSGSGFMNTIANAAKMGGAGYVGEQARSLIDEGKTSDNAGMQAGIMAAITALVPIASKVVGMLSKSVPAAEASRIATMKADNAPADRVLQAM